MKPLLTIAATSDIHINEYPIQRDFFSQVNGKADLLLIAGDMNDGIENQIQHFLDLISEVKIPIFIIFGNHDTNENDLLTARNLLVSNTYVTVLDGEYAEIRVKNVHVGIAGAKGFGGGFTPNELRGNIGEKIMKDFRKEIDREVEKLGSALEKMAQASPDVKIAMTHWAAFKEVIEGEHIETYPFLGSSKLGDVIEQAKVHLAISGHAHFGPSGLRMTSGGIFASNVGYLVNKEKMIFFDFLSDKTVKRRD